MNQDIRTALQEMRNPLLFMATGAAKIFLNLTAATVAIFLLGAFVWLVVHYFLWSMLATVITLLGVWFRVEYRFAKEAREYYEMCQVNKGETK